MKKKIIKHRTTYYEEIFQSINTKFAFVTKRDGIYKELFCPAKCRDFLGDCIYSMVSGAKVNIYSFIYSFKDSPFDIDKTRLSLSFPNNHTMINFKQNFPTLNIKESKYKIAKSIWYETDDENTLVIEASKVWQSSIWKLSLFTFYLKLLCYKTAADIKDPETLYLESLTEEKEKKLLQKIREKREIFLWDMTQIHGYSGFFTIIKGERNKEMTKLLLG